MMFKDYNVNKWIVYKDSTILDALNKIDTNNNKHVYVVDEHDYLLGIFSDGDFRRWVTSSKSVDVNTPLHDVYNRGCVSASIEDSPDHIEFALNDQITTLPLLDDKGHVLAIACRGAKNIIIGDREVAQNSSAFIIAEIGNNHNGDIGLAKQLVDHAVLCGADCAKFQLRDMKNLYRASGGVNDVSEDLGSQYTLDLLKKFQLKDHELFEVFDYCKSKDIIPLCTPWDVQSVRRLEEYGVDAYKIASADLTNMDLIMEVIKTGKPIICSTGMSKEHEIIQAVNILRSHSIVFALLHCNSTYPAPFKDINLKYLERLSKIGGCVTGYSGHERGISVPIAAVAMGAKIIEKHFTLDQRMEGNDHKVSLEPDEFAKMVEAIREVEQAVGKSDPRTITQGELINRETLGKSLISNRDIKAGEVITDSMIDISAPGKGLPPYEKRRIVGHKAKRDINKGDFFFESDILNKKSCLRKFDFYHPYGIPVRYWDFEKLVNCTNLDLVEFHLSYSDLNEEPGNWIKKKYDKGCVVHSPELFAGDHILDLCSDDEEYRQHSISELQRVIGVTRNIASYFINESPTQIVVNVGGFSKDYHLPIIERSALYDKLLDSLGKLDSADVEIIPQTMPPFPWHFGGQSHHNIFVDAEEISEFCETHNYRICLDVSHSKLASNFTKVSFSDFLAQVAPYVAHMHLADAESLDGEGLQIGEGDIDFSLVAKQLRSSKASFIPEIWQGHKDSGEGFWVALDKLEKWF